MAKFAGKIHAIKALREMFANANIGSATVEVLNGEIKVKPSLLPASLLECKNFVEACLEMAEQPTEVYKLTRVSVMNGSMPVVHETIGLYYTRQRAVEVRNSVMRLKGYNECYETENDYDIFTVPIR